jgi:capsular polysaccharide biosynthesis protein
MSLSAIKDILGITFFSLADFLDMKDEELHRLINFRVGDSEPQQTADITAKLTKQGLKIPHNTVGNDIVIISTELGQSEITTISRP